VINFSKDNYFVLIVVKKNAIVEGCCSMVNPGRDPGVCRKNQKIFTTKTRKIKKTLTGSETIEIVRLVSPGAPKG
jgi:hypothetical protein